jgi:hypothetical protein
MTQLAGAFPMDLIVLDDDLTIAEYIAPIWEARGITLFQTDDPELLFDPLDQTAIPAKWPRAPHRRQLSGIVLDIDLGGHLGPLGGVVAAARLAAARERPGSSLSGVPVVIRTQHLSKERDLAAVFIAELLGEPVSWWDRGRDNPRLLEFFSRLAASPTADLRDLDVKYVRPLRVFNRNKANTRQETGLAQALLGGNRWKLWTRVDMFGKGLLNFRGEARTTWENMERLPTALTYMLETNQSLHSGELRADVGTDEIYSGPLDVDITDHAVKRLRGVDRHSKKEDAAQVLAEYRQVIANPLTVQLLAEAGLVQADVGGGARPRR